MFRNKLVVLLLCQAICIKIINGFEYVFDDLGNLGRRFDGIGAISGGGATSKLLTSYPKQQQSEILDYLFKPNFGASLQILKVEIGGDGQSSEGTESSHMHESWDENYSRGYEWWLMTEAKKRNPHIKLAGLAWSFPGWLGDGQWWPYGHADRTADYIIRWILGANTTYGLKIDYIGIWNEKPLTTEYVKVLRKQLDARGLSDVKIVAADHIGNAWAFVKQVDSDPELKAAIDILGGHYTGTYSTDEAKATGLPIWSSEDYSTNYDLRGTGCMARIINRNYVNGLMTSTIAWNMLVAYYSKLPYFPNGLMPANEPWSGHYEVKGPIWMAAHTTQFTAPGWRYLDHDHGVGYLQGGGSYVTLVSPNKKDITVIIETMDTTHRDYCVRVPESPQPVSEQNITLIFDGTFANLSQLHLWHSQLGKSEAKSVFFKDLGSVKIVNGQVTLPLLVDAVYTLTSVTSGHKGMTSPPKQGSFPIPYNDNFDSYPEHSEAALLAQQVGVFEVHNVSSSGYYGNTGHGRVVRQVMTSAPIHWCPLVQTQPMTVIGDYSWSDVNATVDFWVGKVNSTDGVFVATRISNGGCQTFMAKGVFLNIHVEHQMINLCHDLACALSITSKEIKVSYNNWHSLSLATKGNHVTAQFDHHVVLNQTVNSLAANGFVGFGTGNFGLADFDNLFVLPA